MGSRSGRADNRIPTGSKPRRRALLRPAPLAESTQPFLADWEDRKGVPVWTRPLAPAEEEVIAFGYRITYPDDLKRGGF